VTWWASGNDFLERTLMLRWLKMVLPTIFLLVFQPSPTWAKSWEQAIKDVEALAEQHWQTAQRKGHNEPLGNAFNEIDVEMHLCAILGRLVGHKNSIGHLEPPQPDKSASGREFAIAATSLGNWIIAARHHTTLSSEQRRRLWNLECVGKHGIPRDLYVPVERGFQVSYDASRKSILVRGDITAGFAAIVERAIQRYPEAEVVTLGSGGGAVYEAMRAGIAIRRAGLNTELSNACYSACPLALAGGVDRLMWTPYSDVGLHQVSLYGVALPPNHDVYHDIAAYFHLMGIQVDVALLMILAAKPSQMYLLDEAERCSTKLITYHQRGCTVQP